MRFSASSQKPNPENRFLVNLRSFFSTYNNFPVRKWLISVSTINGKYFKENMISLVGLKKKLFNFPQCTDFRHFWLLRSTFKSIFSTYTQNYRKYSVSFLVKVVKNLC